MLIEQASKALPQQGVPGRVGATPPARTRRKRAGRVVPKRQSKRKIFDRVWGFYLLPIEVLNAAKPSPWFSRATKSRESLAKF